MPPFDESALVFRDDGWEDFLKPGRDNFCDYIITFVTKRNWAKSAKIASSFLLTDEHQEGSICAPFNFAAMLIFSYHYEQIIFDCNPTRFEESG